MKRKKDDRKGEEKSLTVEELAEEAGVTKEIMLQRLATVIQNRPWQQRVELIYHFHRNRGLGVIASLLRTMFDP